MTHPEQNAAGRYRGLVRKWLESPARVGALMLCLALAMAGAISPPGALAQTLTYDTGIDLPEWVRLWYWDTIPLTIDASELTDFYFGTGSGTGSVDAGSLSLTAGFQGGMMTVDADIGSVVDDDLVADPGSDYAWIRISNAWALQSISNSGQTQVSIRVRNKNANTQGGSARIRARDAMVGVNTNVGQSINAPQGGYFGYWGDAYLQLDLSQADEAGTYDGIRVEITAENI